MKAADLAAHSDYHRKEKEERLRRQRALYEEILRQRDCLSLKDLAVTGKDLIAAGVAPGPALGDILQRMLEAVLQEPSLNDKAVLMERFLEGKKP